jgi:hypothetical protein
MGLEFWVLGVECRVVGYGLGFEAQGLRFRIQGYVV